MDKRAAKLWVTVKAATMLTQGTQCVCAGSYVKLGPGGRLASSDTVHLDILMLFCFRVGGLRNGWHDCVLAVRELDH